MPDSECCMILWLSFSELWFGLGKCDHHRRCDPVIQCVLTRQPQLHRTASGIWCQTPAGVLSSFPYTRGRQQRYPWPQLKWQGEKAPLATCGALFIANNCREKPRWRCTFCGGNRYSGNINSPVLCVGRSPRMSGNPHILGHRCWSRHSSSGNPSVCSFYVSAVPLHPEASLRW